MRTTCGWLAAGIIVLGAAAPARCQDGSLSQLLSGTTAPTTLKLKDLGADWKRITISGPTEAKPGSLSQMAGGFMGMLFGGGMPSMGTPPPYYTQGKTLALGGETFLIAYRAATKGVDFGTLMRLGNGGGDLPQPERLTSESAVSLQLVNVRSIQTVSDIRPFNLQQEIADSAKAAQDEAELMRQMQKGGPLGGGGIFNGPGPDVQAGLTAPDKPEPAKSAPKKATPPKKAPAKK